MNTIPPDFRLKKPEEFFESPRENKAIDELKNKSKNRQQSLLDESYLREQEDWTFLGNKIVGAEET